MSKLVSLKYLEEYEVSLVEEKLREALFDLNLMPVFKPKMRVMIKACLPSAKSPDFAETTHPSVVRALINILTELGVKCVVADCPYGKHSISNIDQVYLNTGMLEVANFTNCELNEDLRTCELEIPDGRMTKRTTVLSRIFDVDAIINVGKLKCDTKLGLSASLSNMLGVIPGELKTVELNRLNTVNEYYNYILDLHGALSHKVVLNVLDGIVALETTNTQRMMSCLAVSDNAIALDSAMVEILDMSREESVVRTATDRGMYDGESIRYVSERPDKFKVEDFGKGEIASLSPIHKDKHAQKRYYNTHQQRVVINPHKCKGCGICSEICPTGAIMMRFDKLGELEAVVDYSKCIHCFKCHTACPYKVVDVHMPIGYKKLKREIDKENT